MKITSEVVYGLVGSCLANRFDNPQPIPKFHKELWDLCCSNSKCVAVAAPRGHAKSTSVTLGYLLATLLFKDRDYAIIVSDTEGQAIQFLSDIKNELSDNDSIVTLFGNMSFIKDRETDIIVQMSDGHQFRVQAKGSEQKVRGLKWRSKRPNLIIGDDLENDEIVMNKDRREKFRNWLFKALLPALSDEGVIRIVGTILHMDSALERLLCDPNWVSARFRAHNEDFTEILWPEKFTKERLMAIRDSYVAQGIPEGYSQEYLNYPIDESTAYFRRDDFRWYDLEDIDDVPLNYYSAIDFAISDKERADYTVIVTVGIDSNNNMYVVDVKRGRWDAKEIIDEMFVTHLRYRPEIFIAEDGMIKKSLGPFLKERMLQEGVFINLHTEIATKDKLSRARSIQARLRTGSVYFNRDTDWYADLEQEMIRFPKDVHDDQVDALAWIGLVLGKTVAAPTAKERDDEEWDEWMQEYDEPMGMSMVTGY